MSNSLQPYGLQHTRLPCPSPSHRVCSNSPLIQWCHPIISSSAILFSCCLQSFPTSGSFPMSQLFTRWPKYWSFSFSISLSNEYSGLISFRINWFDLLQSKGLSRGFSSITIPNHQLLSLLFGLILTSIHTRLLEKPELWLYGPLSAKWCLCFLICCLGLS